MNYKDKAYKYKFRTKELSRTQVKNNILEVLREADVETYKNGLNWYLKANEIAFNEVLISNEINLAQAVGVIAALSPMKSWDINVKLASEFIREGKRGGHFKLCVDKADAILKLDKPSAEKVVEILNGQKIVNFFLNIYYPNKDVVVTIDRHAIGIALLGSKRVSLTKEDLHVTKKQFEFLSHCYKWAASELGVSAIQLQAITWEHFRKLKIK
jgi:hypothetical protein